MTETIARQERDALAELAFSPGAKYANRLLVGAGVPGAACLRLARCP